MRDRAVDLSIGTLPATPRNPDMVRREDRLTARPRRGAHLAKPSAIGRRRAHAVNLPLTKEGLFFFCRKRGKKTFYQ